ncbi:saccharopine dehydrogenase family protein [Mobilicoccus pelagius]|uniref:Saccharopine dehydrogenase NADP binding domain-containing protein n=1 Tax=Mobilicoccus pelagius NBRC 104925 TaxID=1089455 RepID=H5UU73_9MICO|nr:saccharopine dehydrogenase NADP-binding domain-containing protein [Mobilicoccus pelagius]GAB49281.1 hypothetical protein MOPEL_099_00810 [Mobilicoccus pelagius NBRC 104925]
MDTQCETDVVVFGATGFVGRLIAAHLARHAPEDVRVGLGGRSEDRLKQVRSELPARAADWPLVVADSADLESLRAMAGRTRVVLTTVGPYARHGMPLVRACAESGTDYVDLTGETLFARTSADEYHEVAKETGARIVHSCGFDSVPSDLGVLLTAAKAREDGEGELAATTLHVRRMKGGFSGGTLDSMRTQIDEVKGDKRKTRIAVDPYGLSPDRDAEPEPFGRTDQVVLARSGETRSWTAPFFMGAYNGQVVRRSNALQDWAYGRTFRYGEVIDTGRSRTSPLKALALAGALPALSTALGTPGLRQITDRVLPSPGEGPSKEKREAGEFAMEVHAETTTGAHYVTTIAAPFDPGYDGTAIMIGEAALALARDTDRLPERAGVLTPATGIGAPLADRLRAQGFTVETRKS